MGNSVKGRLRNILVLILIYLAGMLAVFGLSVMGVSALVIFPVFILGILIDSLEFDSGIYGAVLGVLYLLSYDLLFTYPYYQFKVFSRDDLTALVIFLAVALIMNVVTLRMKHQVEVAERNELAIGRLNRLSTSLIDSTSAEGACETSQAFLSETLGRMVNIILGEPGADSEQEARDCYFLGHPTGHGEPGHSDTKARYLPLRIKNTMYGVVALDCASGGLDKAEESFLSSVLAQTMIAVERIDLEDQHRQKEIEEEGERFKSLLLQSVSHDLRTPLTCIAGNAGILLTDTDITPETRKKLLQSIRDDALWLDDMIENLLFMSRMQDEGITLKKGPEIVDDIVGMALEEMDRRKGDHRIDVSLPDGIVIADMNGRLITRVLVNLIDNAIKHSNPGSAIDVSACRVENNVRFSIADHGEGISEESITRLFTPFYTES